MLSVESFDHARLSGAHFVPFDFRPRYSAVSIPSGQCSVINLDYNHKLIMITMDLL